MAQVTPLAVAAFAASVAAACFLFNVIKGFFDARRSREISAREAWEKYLVMAFHHPRLANPDLAVDEPLTAEEEESYEWFVSRMLYAAEEVLILVGEDPEWRKVFLDQIDFHRPYLGGKGRNYLGGYSRELKRMFIQSGLALPDEEEDEDDSCYWSPP